MNEMKEEQEELSTLMIRQKFFLLKNHSQRFFFALLCTCKNIFRESLWNSQIDFNSINFQNYFSIA